MTTQPSTTKVWAERISAAWQATLDGIFKVGDLLIAAKEELEHGQFGKMIANELPFGSSTAARLMTIARDQRLRNPAHAQHLPPSWYLLYRLSQLSDPEFNARLVDGRIHADMEREEIEPAKNFIFPQVSTPQPRPTMVTLQILRNEPEQRQVSEAAHRELQRALHEQHNVVAGFKAAGNKGITAPSETATQALRVIENLELLEGLLNQAIATEIVGLLNEPNRREQLFRVSRALHALNDLATAIESRRPSVTDRRRAVGQAAPLDDSLMCRARCYLFRRTPTGRCPMSPAEELESLHAEIARLQDAKRRALALTDERSKENVLLRAENARLHGELDALKRREPRD